MTPVSTTQCSAHWRLCSIWLSHLQPEQGEVLGGPWLLSGSVAAWTCLGGLQRPERSGAILASWGGWNGEICAGLLDGGVHHVRLLCRWQYQEGPPPGPQLFLQKRNCQSGAKSSFMAGQIMRLSSEGDMVGS